MLRRRAAEIADYRVPDEREFARDNESRSGMGVGSGVKGGAKIMAIPLSQKINSGMFSKLPLGFLLQHT